MAFPPTRGGGEKIVFVGSKSESDLAKERESRERRGHTLSPPEESEDRPSGGGRRENETTLKPDEGPTGRKPSSPDLPRSPLCWISESKSRCAATSRSL
jgi:hypothetical protein